LESIWNPPGIWLDPGRIRIHTDPGESGGNGRNLVGIWWESFLVQVKFGWVLTDMIFLPNSYHSYHSTWSPARIRLDPRGMCGAQ
jgi:hypothetical protein